MDLDHFCYNCDSVLEISGRLGMVGDGGKKDTVQYFGHAQSAYLDVVNFLGLEFSGGFFASAFLMDSMDLRDNFNITP